MKKTILLAITFTINLHSASFDCNKASTAVEKTICSDSEISQQDSHLNAIYAFLNKYVKKREFDVIKASQRDWIAKRDNCSINSSSIVDCVNQAYTKRIEELKITMRDIVQAGIDNLHEDPESFAKLSAELNSVLLHLYDAYAYNKGLYGKPDNQEAHHKYMQALKTIKRKLQVGNSKKKQQLNTDHSAELLWNFEMNNAINESVIDEIESTYKVDQLKGITTFIYALHFTRNTAQCIPNYAIKEDWEGSGIGTYGGYSSIFILGEYCPIPDEMKILNIDAVATLHDILEDVYGNPGIHVCTGSIEYAHSAARAKMFMAANLNPYVFDEKSVDEKSDQETEKFLKIWSSYGVWNHYTYQAYRKALLLAEKKLSDHYMKEFSVQRHEADKLSETVINLMKHAYAGHFSSGKYGPLHELHDPVFKLYMQEKLHIEEIQKLDKLNQEQLDKALKLMLLKNQDKSVITYFIKQGARVNHGQESALFHALGDVENTKLLIDTFGAKVDYQNCFAKTPLFSAIQIGNIDVVELLLNRGADVNHATAMLQGYIYDDAPQKNTSCNGCFNVGTGGRTPLMYALWQGSEEMITSLISKGADTQVKDSQNHNCAYYLKKNDLLSETEKDRILQLIKSDE